ncbi:hypothetical protein LBMAG48_24570 [Phycisphaerae bacterium]|nr:hypothetical protein LBMAG48_24570 [Phycisphaerae bacterium]
MRQKPRSIAIEQIGQHRHRHIARTKVHYARSRSIRRRDGDICARNLRTQQRARRKREGKRGSRCDR